MIKNKRLWTLIFLGLAVGAIILLAASLSEIRLLPGHHFAWPTAPLGAGPEGSVSLPNLDIVWVILAIAFWVLLPISIIYFIISREARKRVLRDILWIAAIILIGYLITRAFKQLNHSSQALAPPSAQPRLPGENLPPPAGFISHPPSWLVYGLDLLLIALILTVLWYLWKRLRLRESPLQQLAQEAGQALGGLRAGADLKDTVLRCYRDMTRLLSEHRGIHRQRAMTPREFERHLRSLGLRDDHVQRLTQLFEAARYGAKTADQGTEREAQACLEAIVAAYGRPM